MLQHDERRSRMHCNVEHAAEQGMHFHSFPRATVCRRDESALSTHIAMLGITTGDRDTIEIDRVSERLSPRHNDA